jgi:hypothetical protein
VRGEHERTDRPGSRPRRAVWWALAASALVAAGLVIGRGGDGTDGTGGGETASPPPGASTAAAPRAAAPGAAAESRPGGRTDGEPAAGAGTAAPGAAVRDVEAGAWGTAEPAPRVVLADGGRRVELAPDGALRGLDELPAELRAGIAAALAAGRLALPAAVRELGGRPSALRGAGTAPAGPEPLSPVATAVAADRPTFRWRPVPGATAYRTSVFDAGYRPVAESGWIEAPEWTPERPLPAGEALSWQVTARLGDREATAPAPPAPEARFRVGAPAELAPALEAAGRTDSRLARAVLFAGAGLVEAAEVELAALAAANPGSDAARSLLASVQGAGAAAGPPSPTRMNPAQ